MILAFGIGFAAAAVGLTLWLGTVLIAARAGWPVDADQVLAWIVACFVAGVMWPVAIAGFQRRLWNRRNFTAGAKAEQRSDPIPKIRLSLGERIVRVLVLATGAALILAICGPQEVTAEVLGSINAASAGRRSAGALVQLLTFVFWVVGFLVVELALGGRRQEDAEEDLRREVRNTWFSAAVGAWPVALMVGLFGAGAIINYL